MLRIENYDVKFKSNLFVLQTVYPRGYTVSGTLGGLNGTNDIFTIRYDNEHIDTCSKLIEIADVIAKHHNKLEEDNA